MIDFFIKQALENDHIQSKPIEHFTIEQLNELSEKARDNNLLITLRVEHSNVWQGTLVNLIKKEIANKFLKYL
ncbi:hypothetical protein [Clostridium felsineum]|uniref:hypothetical protein n=1 Tax=Clostridium felsineum TaxID=36839 RepID=UPI00098C972C|nr:hypothetical protein [Clostridium felsineum]URZ15314.1 hypothetical protein CLFE_013320 [Clostridium felsineum DSM 794]